MPNVSGARSTPLLVSVRNAQEARAALRGGADVIDVKEPSRGSLGRADASTTLAVLDTIGSARPVTAAAGDLGDQAFEPLPAGLAMWKIGLAGRRRSTDWGQQVERLRAECAGDACLVPVAYADADRADSPAVEAVIDAAADAPNSWVMIDTYDKSPPGLFEILNASALERLVDRAHRQRTRIALAGRLDGATAVEAARLGADLVGVRGAAAGGDRQRPIDARSVRALRDRLCQQPIA